MKKSLLLICTDHWSSVLTGIRGHDEILLPTIKQMGSYGVTYPHAYSACPSCVPARRSLMTGLSARSHGDRKYQTKLPLPEVTTLAEAFVQAGYQAHAVGKMHVYPQRNRAGFHDVILEEQGRKMMDSVTDDYELFLQDRGFAGRENEHGLCHNDFFSRVWHLPEDCHPINWAAREMCRTIKRRDPEKPGFWYLSFSAPHPPLAPLQTYLDMYADIEIPAPTRGNWSKNTDDWPFALKRFVTYQAGTLVGSPLEHQLQARRAFYATLTHLDHQIRMVMGFLREEGILDDTSVVFMSDHGHMIGEHGMWSMTPMYEMSATFPLIIMPYRGYTKLPTNHSDDRLVTIEDIMPTLLDLNDIDIPEHVEGNSLISGNIREYVYGEHQEDQRAMRMIRKGDHKLIYYPSGNHIQLFNLKEDPKETNNVANQAEAQSVIAELKSLLMSELYGSDTRWIGDGDLVGEDDLEIPTERDRQFGSQRGYRFI